MNRDQIAAKRERFADIREQYLKAGRRVSADLVNRTVRRKWQRVCLSTESENS